MFSWGQNENEPETPLFHKAFCLVCSGGGGVQKTPRPPQASAPEPPAPRPIHPCKHISPPPCKRKPTWVGGDKGRPIWAHFGPHSLRIRAPPDTDRKTDDWLSDKR